MSLRSIVFLLVTASAPIPVQAGMLQCTVSDSPPLFTDVPLQTDAQCSAYAADHPWLSVNSGMMVGDVDRSRSASTKRQMQGAKRARLALRKQWEQKNRQCERARDRAIAAHSQPMGKRKQLNINAYYACR